mgnify:CR=1 FL=1
MGDRARLHRAVGNNVDHDEKRKERETMVAMAKSLGRKPRKVDVAGLTQAEELKAEFEKSLKSIRRKITTKKLDKKQESVENAIKMLKDIIMKRMPEKASVLEEAIIENASGNNDKFEEIITELRENGKLTRQERAIMR